MRIRAFHLLAAALILGGAVDPNDPFDAAAIEEHPGAQVPLGDQFRDAAGNSVSLRAIAGGKPLLITPVQHECPNICGVTLAGLADAIDGQDRFRPGRDFAAVAFGIDPREGPAQARDDLGRLAAQRRSAQSWQPVALTGPEAQIHKVTDALGYRYAWDDRIHQYAHLSGTAVLTPDGRLSSWLYGVSPTPAEVEAAIDQARAGGTGGVMQRLLLLCFHYDPLTGRYSLAITHVVRIAGILTIIAIGLLFALLRRRHGAAVR